MPGLKRPWLGSDGKVLTLGHWDLVEAFYCEHPEANVGACCAPIEGSPIIVVDIDICDVEEQERGKVWKILGDLGVTLKDTVWAQRTGRDNYQVFYWAPSWEVALPKRHMNAGGLHIDLIANGYVVVAPSDTSQEPPKKPGIKGGGPYRWINGKSPWDLNLSDVNRAPATLLTWWRNQVEQAAFHPDPTLPDIRRLQRGNSALDTILAEQYIGEYRNVNLTKVAGRLALHHNEGELLALLRGINQTHCRPPLPDREIVTIARSIAGRESHKNGIRSTEDEVLRF